MSAKILVADESPTIHRIVAMAFENEGITVEGISRGEHALEYMVEYKPDIVLADIHLPGVDGYELCRQIKNSPTFGNTRVILLTSDFEDLDQVELEISRADDFISKPFKTEEILNKVKSQLSMPESKQEAQVNNAESHPETENNEVIQNEFEDIVNQPEQSSSDPLKQLFDETEDSELSIDEIDLETDTPSKMDEILPEIIVELPNEIVRAETRPQKIMTDDLDSVFQSVLSSPESGQEETAKPEPGTKPNLIEETLSFMSRQHTGEELEIIPSTESVVRGTSGNSTDHSVSDRIIKEHMDQVVNRLPEDAKDGASHATLERTVREVLGEVAPNIIRKVIQEEIETIKKSKEA